MQRFPAGRVTGILLSRFRSLSMIAMSGPHAGTGGAARVTLELVTAALFHSVHERPASWSACASVFAEWKN